MKIKIKKFLTGFSLLSILLGSISFSATAATYTDLQETDQYKDAIEFLTSEGIVNGNPDGTFQPQKTLNRAEMLKTVVESHIASKKLPPKTIYEYNKNCFPDISTDEWYTRYICYAKEQGWIKGYQDGTFKPGQEVTFAEALKITYKGFDKEFVEDKEVWYKNLLADANEKKLVPPSIATSNVEVKRNEMSDMLARVIQSDRGELDKYLVDKVAVNTNIEREIKEIESGAQKISRGSTTQVTNKSNDNKPDPQYCGNKELDPFEVCDGSMPGTSNCNATCTGYTTTATTDNKTDTGSTLTRKPDPQYCGNKELDPFEVCDGSMSGSSNCNSTCTGYKTSTTTTTDGTANTGSTITKKPDPQYCGNKEIDPFEVCDGSIPGTTNCNATCTGYTTGTTTNNNDNNTQPPSTTDGTVTTPPVITSPPSTNNSSPGTPTPVYTGSIQWSTFTPGPNARIIYVSSNGDDSTATFYSPSASEIGGNVFSPSGAIQPYKTLSTAMNQVRDGSGDWVLLKKGDQFQVSSALKVKSGASSSEKALIGAYGSGSTKPQIIPSANGLAVLDSTKTLSHFAVVGIDFYNAISDPGSSSYNSSLTPNNQGFLLLAGSSSANPDSQDILVEDCKFSYFITTLNLQGINSQLSNVTLRGNVIRNAYSTNSHASGIFALAIHGLLLEGNVFDHNGWLVPTSSNGGSQSGGQATIFNHNVYLSSTHDVIVRNNIFTRASSIGLKIRSEYSGGSDNILVQDNLFVEGEIGVRIGGDTASALHKFDNVTVKDNVFLHIGRTQPTARPLAWGVTVDGLDGTNVIENNLFTKQEDSALSGNAVGIEVSVKAVNTTIRNNTFYNWQSTSGAIRGKQLASGSSVNIVNNEVQSPGFASTLVNVLGSGYSFSGNSYHSANGAQLFKKDNQVLDTTAWQTATGEIPNLSQIGYPTPSVSIESYLNQKGQGSNFQDFINRIIAQSRAGWNSNMEAKNINAYFRAGFGM